MRRRSNGSAPPRGSDTSRSSRGVPSTTPSCTRSSASRRAERQSYLRAGLALKCVFLVGIGIVALPAGWALAQLFGKSTLASMLALAVVTGGLLNVLSLQLADYLADERFLRLTLFNTIYSVL